MSTSLAIHLVSASLAPPLFLRSLLLFPRGLPAVSWWERFGPWMFIVIGPIEMSIITGFPLPIAIAAPTNYALQLVLMTICVALVAWSYRRGTPIERRQLKWLVVGTYCAVIPPIVGLAVTSVAPRFAPITTAFGVTLVIAPLAFLVACLRNNLYDIDGLISATASYNLAIAAVVVVGILVVPRVAGAASTLLAIDPTFGEAACAVVLVAMAAVIQGHLRPGIERFFFPERHRLATGVREILDQLNANAAGASDEVLTAVASRIAELIRPRHWSLFVRRGIRFVRVAGTSAVGDEIADEHPLVRVLADRRAPLASDEPGWRSRDRLSAFERATLEELDSSVVVPLRSHDRLAALFVLGVKRSGDIYTPSDIARLWEVFDGLSVVLGRGAARVGMR